MTCPASSPNSYYYQMESSSQLKLDRASEFLPYWQTNVPVSQRTKECPPFLLSCSEKDQAILATPDEQYFRLSWPAAKHLVLTNRIDLLSRVPSDLRRYKQFLAEVMERYGSIMKFIITERLNWDGEGGMIPKGAEVFEDPGGLNDGLKMCCYMKTNQSAEQAISRSCTMTGHMAWSLISHTWSYGSNPR